MQKLINNFEDVVLKYAGYDGDEADFLEVEEEMLILKRKLLSRLSKGQRAIEAMEKIGKLFNDINSDITRVNRTRDIYLDYNQAKEPRG